MPDDSTLPPLSQAGPRADASGAIDFVRDLQHDGRLLLRHVARRTDRALGVAVSGPEVGNSALYVLTADPTAVAADHAQIEALAACVDVLSRQAAPANASTIRLTSAYLRTALEGNEPPEEVRARVWRLRLVIKLIIAWVAVAMLCALALLAHVDDGRRMMQQLQEVRTQLDTIFGELAKLPQAAWIAQPAGAAQPQGGGPAGVSGAAGGAAPTAFLPFCNPEGEGDQRRWRAPAAGEAGSQAQALCSQWAQAAKREALVFLRLQDWNCRTQRFVPLWRFAGNSCADTEVPPLPAGSPVGAHDWNRTEMRTGGIIAVLSGFVLPLLMGSIGGCAYVLRRLDQRLSDHTLEIRDGWHSVLRVLLATVLGGLLGAVWSGDHPVTVADLTLSLAAVAFFVGFALEAVFTLIEAMVDGVAGRLRAPLPTGAVPALLPSAPPRPPPGP